MQRKKTILSKSNRLNLRRGSRRLLDRSMTMTMSKKKNTDHSPDTQILKSDTVSTPLLDEEHAAKTI